MKIGFATGLCLAIVLASTGGALGEAQPSGSGSYGSDASEPPGDRGFVLTDYTDLDHWLCHPDLPGDGCDVDIDRTLVMPDGTTRRLETERPDSPPIDCFYIYPTVSEDLTPNSDLEMGPGEQGVVAAQFAPFARECRLFAPAYRQTTLFALNIFLQTGQQPANEEMRYADVAAAWETYLRDHNDGRGVVLIGHSQGAELVQQLLRRRIFGRPVADRILSAMPIGFNTPLDPETGRFGDMPPCETAGQIGCLISYVSFRADSPPDADAWFGRMDAQGQTTACTNPAALTDENATGLDAWLLARSRQGSGDPEFGEGIEVTTRFAEMPGLLSATCRSNDSHSWLAVSVSGDPSDPRADDIAGDLVIQGEIQTAWGLHLVDMNLAMGNLLDIVAAQSKTFAGREVPGPDASPVSEAP